LKSAEKAFSTAADDAQRAEARELRGNIYLAVRPDGKNFKRAEDDYRAAAALNPAWPEYHLRIAIALFKQSHDDEGKQEAQRYLQLDPAGRYASEAQGMIDNPRTGRFQPAPGFQLSTLQGETITREQLSGKVVVLDFWATWCQPCRESVGDPRDLVKKYPSDQFVLISISADNDEQKLRQFLTQKKMDWRQCWDQQGGVRTLFGIHAFPTYLVIDADGLIRERIQGMNPQESVVHRLKETLPSLFDAKTGK
jgi:peroxiredoxin